MTSDQFHELCRQASRLAAGVPGRIGNLVLSVDDRGESVIREPEMLHAFCRILDAGEHSYGIEVPTDGRYRFVDQVGERTMRARHDLVIFGQSGPEVLVELKREQPAAKGEDFPAISKDLRKLLLEEAGGKCMFHLCHASDAGTLPAVIKKYVAAFAFAMASVDAREVERVSSPSWFAFYLVALHDRNDNQQAVLRRFLAPSLAALRAEMPVLDLDQFDPELIPRP
jgi:hypothetical protein